jgi:hypothetical protein
MCEICIQIKFITLQIKCLMGLNIRARDFLPHQTDPVTKVSAPMLWRFGSIGATSNDQNIKTAFN